MVLLIIFSVLSELLAISTGFAKAVADLSEEGKIKFKTGTNRINHSSVL